MATPLHAVQLVQVVDAVHAYEAARLQDDVSFYAATDLWLFDSMDDAHVCPLCNSLDYHGIIFGDQLLTLFPYLTIDDRDTIAANVHPHCRCKLRRVVRVEVPR